MLHRTPYTCILTILSLLTTSTHAQYNLLDWLSFGHTIPLSTDGTTIPHWTIHGADPPPTLFSERIQLTPPYPGNKRGGLWTQQPLQNPVWDLSIEFRASGPERGGGNLQFWLLKDKSEDVGLASVYKIDKFDGLVLVLDQYGGQGGSLRGFLNDGSTNFRQRQDVDGLAFGHCTYPYRNLGRMSRLKVRQDPGSFEVLLDEQTCFKTDNMQLPTGYYFGVTAASAENPDAFELSKFVVTTPTEAAAQAAQPPPYEQEIRRDAGQAFAPPPHSVPNENTVSTLMSLTSKLNILTSKMEAFAVSLEQFAVTSTDRHNTVQASLSSLKTTGATTSGTQLDSMAQRIEHIENLLREVQKQVEGRDYQDSLQRMQSSLEETQRYLGGTLGENVTKIINTPAPRLGLYVAIVVLVQIGLAASYVVYKRRRANSPKKLL